MLSMVVFARRLALLATSALLFLAATTPAVGAADFIFAGSGWGHGVGLSQYGAKAMAIDGATYQQIVGRYFSGATTTWYTELHSDSFLVRDETPLWVGLRQQSENLVFAVEEGTAKLCFDVTDLCIATA